MLKDPDLLEDTLVRIARLTEAIAGWQKVLNYTTSVRAGAAAGTLEPLTGLYPSPLVDQVLDLNLDAVPGAAEVLQKVNTVSYVGGGNGYAYEEEIAGEATTYEGESEVKESYRGIIGELKLSITGVGVLTGGSTKFILGTSHDVLTSQSKGEKGTRGFVLKDNNAGDKYVLSVYQ